jgi:hypothetical protein
MSHLGCAENAARVLADSALRVRSPVFKSFYDEERSQYPQPRKELQPAGQQKKFNAMYETIRKIRSLDPTCCSNKMNVYEAAFGESSRIAIVEPSKTVALRIFVFVSQHQAK